MINIKNIKNIINITEEESKLSLKMNKELNLNLNNFLISKIFPDIISILMEYKRFSTIKNTNTFCISETEEPFIINDYKTLGDFLFEPFTNKKIEYSEHIVDVDEYLQNKNFSYFYLMLKNFFNKNPEKIYIDYLICLFFNKIQNINFNDIFVNHIDEKNILISKTINKNNTLESKNKFYNIIEKYTQKENIELNIKCKFNNINLKLKAKDSEVNRFIIEEILNKFLDRNFDFFVKQRSFLSINNIPFDVIEGYSFFEGEISKMNKKEVEQFIFSQNFIRKTLFK